MTIILKYFLQELLLRPGASVTVCHAKIRSTPINAFYTAQCLFHIFFTLCFLSGYHAVNLIAYLIPQEFLFSFWS